MIKIDRKNENLLYQSIKMVESALSILCITDNPILKLVRSFFFFRHFEKTFDSIAVDNTDFNIQFAVWTKNLKNLEFIIQLVFKSYPNLLKSLCRKSLYPKSLSFNINSPFSFNLASFKSKYIISCVNL